MSNVQNYIISKISDYFCLLIRKHFTQFSYFTVDLVKQINSIVKINRASEGSTFITVINSTRATC